MTLRDLLALIAEHGMAGTVSAGEAHLDDRISWVHVFEIPEVVVNIRGGEFLLTTGRVMADLDDRQVAELVRSLERKGSVGLGIEVAEHNRRMTDTIIETAEDIGFPVIVFDRDVPFIQIIHLAHERLLAREMELLRRSAAIQDQLRAAAVHGLSPHGILTQFVTEFGGEMMYVDADGQTLACEPGGEPSAEFLRESQKPSSARMIRCAVVSAGAQIGTVHYLPREVGTDLDRAAVEQTAFVLALASGGSAGDGEDAARSALVQRVAQGRIANAQELRRHAARVHQDFSGRDLLTICVRAQQQTPATASTAPSGQSAAGQLRVALRQTCTELAVPSLLEAGRAVRVRGIIGVRPDEVARTVNRLRERLQAHIGRMSAELAIAGIGLAVTGSDAWDMQRSLDGAQRAALLSALGTGEVRWADRLGGLAFLAEGVMRLGAGETRLDEQSAARLGALSRAGWNKSAAAADLGIRRQTLYRFIDTMSRRLGVDLSSPAGQADATFLYYAHRLDQLAAGDGERWVSYDR
jgi:purine catabolism regulator